MPLQSGMASGGGRQMAPPSMDAWGMPAGAAANPSPLNGLGAVSPPIPAMPQSQPAVSGGLEAVTFGGCINVIAILKAAML